MDDADLAPSDFYTGLVAELYGRLRSSAADPAPYAKFVSKVGEPALELGCGDGEPLLDLIAQGLQVHGLDSSLDMLDRCRNAATARGLDVELHHGTFEAMDLGLKFKAIYLAGATFNLLPNDEAVQQALRRIAAHLSPGGKALIPLFIPSADVIGAVGRRTEHVEDDGTVLSVTVMSVVRDEDDQLQTIALRYESESDGDVISVERDWLLHWIEQSHFASMAHEAGLVVERVMAADGSPADADDSTFSFYLGLPEAGLR